MKKVGKKNVFGVLTALFASVGLLFVSCNSELLESADVCENRSSKYGSVTLISSSVGKSLNVSELTVKSVKVYGYGTDVVSGTVASIAVGKGSACIEKIPVGRRVIEIVSNKTGATLYAVKDIVAGNNTVSVDWNTTAVGKVYYELLKSQEIKDIDSSDFSSAIPDSVHPSLIDASSIAKDYLDGKLKSSSEYVLSSGSVVATVYGYSGKTLQIADPSSKIVTAPADGKTVTFSDVYPGTWNVYADGKKVSSIKVVSGKNTIQIGHQGYRVHLINASSWGTSAPKIYAYSKSNEENNNGWESKPDMLGFSEDWYYDLTYNWFSANDTLVIFFSSDTNRYPADQQSGIPLPADVSEAWYDLTKNEWLKSNPFENKLSSDATLSSLMVNAEKISGFASGVTSYTTEVSSSTQYVNVYAETNDSNATFFVSPAGLTEIEEGSSKDFTVLVTAEDGTTKTYTVKVVRKEAVVDDVSLSSVKVNGSSAIISGTDITFKNSGTEDSFAVSSVVATPTDTNAKVTYSATSGTVSDGSSSTFTITVKNGSKTKAYTLTVSYEKKTGLESEFYWTNKNGYGTNKTISDWSDWTEAEKIAQCTAYDDPRTWLGLQEVPYDVYALYAAYDDTNLYLMVELTNIADRASFMRHDYAGSDNAWWDNRDIPLGFIINTGKGKTATSPLIGSASGKPIWDAINFTDSEGFDFLFYASSKFGYASHKNLFVDVGTPGLFKLNQSTGYFSYESDYCLSANIDSAKGTSGIDVKYIRQCQVSSTIYFESTPTDNRKTSEQTGADLLSSTTFSSVKTGDLDMSYQYTIPLSTLGITKEYLESTGIGVRQITTNGGSLMDCAPWDVSMVDAAGETCSDDKTTSKEKEDVDNIISPLARIGHAK